MALVLLTLLLAQPAPDERTPAEVTRDFAAQVQEAVRLMQPEPERAIEILTALIDDAHWRDLAAQHPLLNVYREQAIYFRGQAQLGAAGPTLSSPR